jgi:hypothetical protein
MFFLGVESSTGGTNIIGSTAYAGTLSSNGPLQFSINNGASIQATINASGNVGIGTATPIAKLDVSGDVRVSGVVTASDTTLISLDGTSAVRQRFFPSSGTGNFNWQIAAQTNVNNGFEITPSSASGGSTFSTPAITVKSDGKVGIGVTAPGTTLGVAGNAQFGGSGGVAGVSSYVDTIGILGSSGSSIGNVGVGTTSPGSLLHLSTAGASYLQIQNTTAANSVYFGNSSGNGIIQVDGANSLNISTNGSERCRVDSSGRLLVGTSSTSADTRAIIQGRSSAGDSTGRLHISSGNDTPGDGDGIAELHFTSSGHVASGRIAAQRDGGTWTAGSSLPTRLTFSTTADGASSPTERMRIKADGDVSIVTGNLIIGTAGKGIDFSADGQAAGMTSELLDDYEEGTWTPTPTFGGGSTGITYATAPVGYYTKVGRMVHIQFGFQLTNKGSSTGNFQVGGLPFTAGGVGSFRHATGSVNAHFLSADNIIVGSLSSGTSIDYKKLNISSSDTNLTNAEFTNNTGFYQALVYFV